MRTIGCDLGSNTLRIVGLDENKHIYKSFEKVIKTAKDLKINGYINENAKKRLFMAFKEACDEFDFKNNKSLCIATEALRVAPNGEDIVKEIEKKFNLKCEIATSFKEAYYSFKGVNFMLERLKIDMKDYILVDMGGASTEISCHKDGEFKTISLPFGVVLISQSCKNQKQIKEYIEPYLAKIDKFIKPFLNLPFVSIAGTPTTVSAYMKGLRYEEYDSKKVNGSYLHMKDFKNTQKALLKMSEKEKIFWVGKGRKDLMDAGITTLLLIMKRCEAKKSLVIDGGLAEGVALDLYGGG